MKITTFYAGLLALMFVALAARVILARRSARVALGDGGDEDLQRRIRTHANFAEHVPMALVLFGLAEGLQTAPAVLHVLGVTLVAGRIAHVISLSHADIRFPPRAVGVGATLGVLSILGVICLKGLLSAT